MKLLIVNFTSKIMKIKLRVFINKRTGQAMVTLPKKKLKIVPKTISFDVKKAKLKW